MRAGAVLLALAALASWFAPPGHAAATPVSWCGSDVAAPDRRPDALAGRQVHVIYAVPADGADRYLSLASSIASDVAAIDAWWRREDPTRTIRFDLFAFPGCASGFGQLDISHVRLPRDSAAYRSQSYPGQAVMLDLFLARVTTNPYKKYLVLYDGLVADDSTCGGGTLTPASPTLGGTTELSIIYIGTPRCAVNQGKGGHLAWGMVHELVHNLGALPPGAPHPCTGMPFGESHTCDDPRDLMYGRFGLLLEGSLDDVVLDPGRDDYYGHDGSWWDVRDSPWLRRLDVPQQQLTVSVVGGPGVQVKSDLPGLECPPACSVAWETGTQVVLAPQLEDRERHRFIEWRDGCTGDGRCVVAMDGPRSVTAVFGPAKYALHVTVVGKGSVVSGSWRCARRCDEPFSATESFELRAVPGKGWRFSGWTGACRGRGVCRIRFDAEKTLRATFRRR